MALTPGSVTAIFLDTLEANAQIGPSVTQFATGLALGLLQYLQAGITVTSIDAGTLGVGQGICPTIVLSEGLLLPAMTASLAGHGIIGPMMPAQANAISLGISVSLVAAQVQLTNPLVGIGVGKLQLIPNGSGGGLFAAAFKTAGMMGTMSTNLGLAVGLGLDAVIASAIGVTALVGTPNIVASAGPGIGKIV
jgi:hypothetical protein